MPKKFHYRALPRPKGLPAKVPTIPVVLQKNGEKVKVVALIDSGSDFMILPKGIAEILKLKGKIEKDKLFGLGGGVDTYSATVSLIVEYDYGHIQLNLETMIINSDEFPVIIGRKGFFDRFEITINEREQFVKIKDLGKA